MPALRVLHVDDEPGIRAVVTTSLGGDPDFAVRSCGTGGDIMAAVSDWSPHIILSHAAAPGKRGGTLLAVLRKSQDTARIPVVFMTGRPEGGDADGLADLGATGIIHTPLDPAQLSESIRQHVRTAGIDALYYSFIKRIQSDAETLAACRARLAQDASTTTLDRIRSVAHGLAGTAGMFGLHEVSRRAGTLQAAVIKAGENAPAVEAAIDRLLDAIERR